MGHDFEEAFISGYADYKCKKGKCKIWFVIGNSNGIGDTYNNMNDINNDAILSCDEYIIKGIIE